jgi:hypothetical protein
MRYNVEMAAREVDVVGAVGTRAVRFTDPLATALRNGDRAMPRGGKSRDETPLSNAERQARYRARHRDPRPPVTVRPGAAVDRRGRPARWRDAVAELVALQVEYAAWFDALPESLRGSATAEALEEIVELDLDALAAIRPPRGYGRD